MVHLLDAIQIPITTRTSPSNDTAAGTGDQPNRWSTALKAIIANSPRKAAMMMHFCTVLASARGLPCIRRRRSAGSVRAR